MKIHLFFIRLFKVGGMRSTINRIDAEWTMNKIRQILCFLLVFNSALLMANPVSPTEALNHATSFHRQRHTVAIRSTTDLKLVYTSNGSASLRSTTTNPEFYIYNIGENQGFVIVAGDDVVKPVLGYSDEGSFREDILPENLKELLEAYRSEINLLRDSGSTDSEKIAVSDQLAWAASSITTVTPLLNNIKWGQSGPFNLLCPYDTQEKSNSVTGCVATAMAQLMKFHRWPETGTGSHSYTENDYGTLTADFSKTHYDWDNMLESYGGSSTPVQDSAVAKLMYHCGVSVDMNYSPSSSAAYMEDAAAAFVGYFGYDNELQMHQRIFYSSTEWKNLILNELNAARPVYFSARSEDGGHAFICDGSDSNGFFHINWGWDGSSNGYFELTSLSSGYSGTTGATDGFALNQRILTGLKKNDGINRASYEIGMYSKLYSSTSSINKATSVTLTFTYANYGTNSFTGKYGIGVVKSGQNTLTKVWENSSNSKLDAYKISSTKKITASLLSSLAEGTYQLYTIYKPADSTSWSIIRGTSDLNNRLTVTIIGTTANITTPSGKPNLVLTKAVEASSNLYQGKETNFDVSLLNNGADYNSYLSLYLFSATDTSLHQLLSQTAISCPAGTTLTYHLTGTPSLPTGQYLLQVLSDPGNSYSKSNLKALAETDLDPIEVQVLATPGQPSLQLNSKISLQPGRILDKNQPIILTADVTNKGGFCDSRIYAFVFRKGGGSSLTYLTSSFLYLDSLGTKTISLSGALDLDPGEYFFKVYYQLDNAWASLTPTTDDSLHFTLTDSGTALEKSVTVEEPQLLQTGGYLTVETTLNLSQIRLYDLAGRLAGEIKRSKTLYIQHLPAGVYLVRLETNQKTFVRRFLKK
jgi:hypothetical protein